MTTLNKFGLTIMLGVILIVVLGTSEIEGDELVTAGIMCFVFMFGVAFLFVEESE